jgi:hypothetical protein
MHPPACEYLMKNVAAQWLRLAPGKRSKQTGQGVFPWPVL